MLSLLEKFACLAVELEDIKVSQQDLIMNNRLLKNEITQLKDEKDGILDSLYELEISLMQSNQYSRRENIEFCNIPESIPQWQLETTIIKILKSININICSYDIVAIHRLGNKNYNTNRNVICRFMNRKNTFISFCRRGT